MKIHEIVERNLGCPNIASAYSISHAVLTRLREGNLSSEDINKLRELTIMAEFEMSLGIIKDDETLQRSLESQINSCKQLLSEYPQ